MILGNLSQCWISLGNDLEDFSNRYKGNLRASKGSGNEYATQTAGSKTLDFGPGKFALLVTQRCFLRSETG